MVPVLLTIKSVLHPAQKLVNFLADQHDLIDDLIITREDLWHMLLETISNLTDLVICHLDEGFAVSNQIRVVHHGCNEKLLGFCPNLLVSFG